MAPTIERPPGRIWAGRRNKWVSPPYTIVRRGRWWKIQIDTPKKVVRPEGRWRVLQDAIDAAMKHTGEEAPAQKEDAQDESADLEDASADAAVQHEHVEENTSPIEIDASDFDDQAEDDDAIGRAEKAIEDDAIDADIERQDAEARGEE